MEHIIKIAAFVVLLIIGLWLNDVTRHNGHP